ncbi:MAG: glycosyltransferase family 4 protein [Planctomycetes bacterium]|nr:glycosyltransferase family 4 protein [Planctomycetota bacterium]
MNKMDKSKPPRILFLNQMAGPLFRELAEDISKKWPPGTLFTGHPDTIKTVQKDFLRIIPAPGYECNNCILRLWSWFKYLFLAFFRYLFLSKNTFVFLVPFPPFLHFIAYLFKRLRGQRYAVLVYDIYPDALINFGPLKESGLITKIWRKTNRVAWENADAVFTIGYKMAENLESMFDSSKTSAGEVIMIPNWANTEWIRPIPKEKNEFAKKHNQVDNLTVMYSGNLGQMHDIETILAAAKELKNNNSIHFMIIGDGIKKKLVEEAKVRDQLDNLTVLPFQPEDILPQSLSTADIAIIALGKGSEGLSVPSKTYYSMASGAAIIALCQGNSEVALTINRHQCGLLVDPGDVHGMVNAIEGLLGDKQRLNLYRRNSRDAAEKFYSRNNTSQYIDILSTVCNI